MSAEQIVDITVIGGGPTGLAAAYYGAHRDATVRIVESLEQLGGQVAAVYPEKHIFDVAGFPKINGQALIDQLTEQAMQYDAGGAAGHGDRLASTHRDDEVIELHTADGETLLTADDDRHRRPRRVRAAEAGLPTTLEAVRGQRPALLRAREGGVRGQAGGAGRRRRLRAGLGAQPAGHGASCRSR